MLRSVSMVLLFGSVLLALGIRWLWSTPADDCTVRILHDDEYQYAVQTAGDCPKNVQRSVIQVALYEYIHEDFPKSLCGLQCIKLNDGEGLGYVIFGAPNYDWLHYLSVCTSVGKLGLCKDSKEGVIEYFPDVAAA